MSLQLEDVVQLYLDDQEFHALRSAVIDKRNASIPALVAVTQAFIHAETTLKVFCVQLEKILRTQEDWGANSFGFMMELNKLSKYHNDLNASTEKTLRQILRGLTAANTGQRIEEFYKFLLTERERLRREGKSSHMIVPASRSPFIISLFAFWLDAEGGPVIYYDSLRKGIYTLVKTKMVSELPGLYLGPGTIEVRTAADYQVLLTLINDIGDQAPQLKINSYWSEFFCRWITDHLQPTLLSASTTIKEDDDADLLARTPTRTLTAREPKESYNYTIRSASQAIVGGLPAMPILIAHDPLLPTPEPLLTQLIHKLQQYILIDETVVRRIYHALLAGHVILTGPPGTGKTELARIIPEILWQSALPAPFASRSSEAEAHDLTTITAYTTRLVTATDDWSTRTLISGIVPQSRDGYMSYKIQLGHLASTIRKNWSYQGENPGEESMETLQRTRIVASSNIERGNVQTFKGQWLVIDEFNRAPIDLALGEALTALGGHDVLRVAIESGSAELPIPQDFRIIGTLNSFDRNYLNQISEALKRRFSFIEILPPGRAQRSAEQGIVLYKALNKMKHLSTVISVQEDSLYWNGVTTINLESFGQYSILWEEEPHAFREAFELAWRLFEVIRIYRQLGTAQAISLVRHMLIAGILQGYSCHSEWITQALDAALCDTIADQLQILLPDEIEVLLLYLTTVPAQFSQAYNTLLLRLASTPQRLYGQLLALSSVNDSAGQAYLADAQVEQIAAQDRPEVPTAILTALFQLQSVSYPLPQFTRRLRTFKAERGL